MDDKRLLLHTNDPQSLQQPDQRISGINFKPPNGKVGTVGIPVMVVLIQLAHHQEVDRKRVARVIANGEIPVTITMSAPVDDRAMKNSHQEMNGQQSEQPRRRRKTKIKPDV